MFVSVGSKAVVSVEFTPVKINTKSIVSNDVRKDGDIDGSEEIRNDLICDGLADGSNDSTREGNIVGSTDGLLKG